MSVTRFTYIRILLRLRRLIRNDHLILVILAIVAGTAAGAAVIGFRETISFIQLALYGSDSEHLFTNTEAVAWWQILLAPVAGGLVVRVLVRYLMPEGRTQGVASQATATSMIPRAITAIEARRHKVFAARLFRIGEIIDRPSPSSPMPTPSSYHNAPGGGKPAKQHLKSPRPRAISRDI